MHFKFSSCAAVLHNFTTPLLPNFGIFTKSICFYYTSNCNPNRRENFLLQAPDPQMNSLSQNDHKVHPTTTNIATTLRAEQTCKNPSCFFCIMKEEPGSNFRRAAISNCFKNISLVDDQQHVLVLSGLWNIAMAHPDDPEFPFLGVFSCMASLITRGVNDRNWLHRDQNIYIPYYAAHVIGSYTMNKPEFAERAVEEGVTSPLLELMKGKISWVEQRVAVRALGHLASYATTFDAIAYFEEELVTLAVQLSLTCLETVYVQLVSVKDHSKRIRYHCDLLTRGLGGLEIENRKAEEWASQLQCWSINILNCFACKERSLNVICGNKSFLKELCRMWGGLMNHTSPAGVGLTRILCYNKIGRKSIAGTKEVVESLCNLSRSSDDWQYMAIDCLVLLLTDPSTRYGVLEIAALSLVDLVELRTLKEDRTNIGQNIARTLLSDYVQRKVKVKNSHVLSVLEKTKALMVDRKRKESILSMEKVEERRVLVNLIKQQGNSLFWSGHVEQAKEKYCEGLELCPLKLRKERMVLYSNRAQCHLLNRDPDAAISDCTRALCLSNPVNSHSKSLWRRSQAYDMKGLAKESLLDCVMFVNGFLKTHPNKGVNKLPYYAARMISKHMDSTWLFANVRSKIWTPRQVSEEESEEGDESDNDELDDEDMMKMIMENKDFTYGLSTILEEPMLFRKGGKGSTLEGPRTRNKTVVPRSYKF